jgi:peptide/nickel transport system permease protein
MVKLVLIKLVRAVATIAFCVTLVFVVLRVSGDPVVSLLPEGTPPDVLAVYRQRWGLDQPLPVQYLRYVQAVLQGDFGRSRADGRDAVAVVAERVPATLLLGGLSFALSLAIGLPLGVLAAVRRNTATDRLAMGLAVAGYALPHYLLGILLILLFSMTLRLLPSSGSGTVWHLVMPVLTLGTAAAGTIARFTRTAMLEVMGRPFLRTAAGKGARRGIVIRRHALPNAAIPVVTVIGFQLGGLVGGALVTETVFAWPGVGRLLVTAVAERDLAVVQTIVLLVAATMVTMNFLVDLLYGLLDPRIRGGDVRSH